MSEITLENNDFHDTSFNNDVREKEELDEIIKYLFTFKKFTNFQIQNFLYYMYGWYLVMYNDEYDCQKMNTLFDATFMAGNNGPYLDLAYNTLNKLRKHGYSYTFDDVGTYIHIHSKQNQYFILNILWIYAKTTQEEFLEMTYVDDAWRNTMLKDGTKEIQKEDIYRYFKSLYQAHIYKKDSRSYENDLIENQKKIYLKK